MNPDLRIGHRGLEHREFDDTYWLNGTRIDHDVYNQELQRIIVHQQVTDQAKLVRELQAQAAAQQSNNAYTLARNQQMQNTRARAWEQAHASFASGFASYWAAGVPTIPPKVREAMDALNPPPVRPPPFKLSLKTSPLFGYMRWNFDSPFKPLKEAFLRWAWKHTRNRVHS